MLRTLVFALALTCIALHSGASEIKIVHDFEDEAELKGWEFSHNSQSLSDQHVTHGKKSLKLAPNEYMRSFKPQDWAGYDTLELDIFVDGESTVGLTLLVGDKDWSAKTTYFNRHNGFAKLKPGANVFSIPVGGLFRGEAGSRNNDLKSNINPREITRFDLGFAPEGKVAGVYLDHMRLVRESRPDGILAFDFGPENQSVFPGFIPITWNTLYGQNGNKAGLKAVCSSPNRARDDTFPTRLYQDWLWFQESGNEFIVSLPNGKYHVWVVFNDCGYWGGETGNFHKRSISANDKQAWVQDRGPDGPNDYRYRFEGIEPHPGDNVWELYCKQLFEPANFEVQVSDGALRLHPEADAPWSIKIAAMIIYPDSKKAEAATWIAEVEDRNRKEFEARAVFLGPKPLDLKVPADAKAKGWWLGFPSLDQDVSLLDAPGAADAKLLRTGIKGQRLSFTFAVRALKDFGEAKLSATDLKGPSGQIPASSIELRYVHHLTQRGFNEISYTIAPVDLRKVDGPNLKLAKDLTRQFWITIAIPHAAKGGLYSGEVQLTAGDLKLSVPLQVEVLDIDLEEPDFAFGFFGVGDRDSLIAMKENGMNSFSGGPQITFSGLDDAGQPKLDFAACDTFFKAAKECGYTKPMYGYGGPSLAGLHDGSVIGATGHQWEKRTGKSFNELLKLVWTAIQAHTDKAGWPQINWGFIDEPRVAEDARAQLELLKAYHEAAPSVRVGGYYSVDWHAQDPLSVAVQDLFKTMSWSGLNAWTETDLEKAKEFGREVHIYNQGKSRFSFGAYQWAAYRKGVKGRMQWMYWCVYGYQFFDLDAREPDTGVVFIGRQGVIPTVSLARCAEGANDFRVAYTLWKLAEKKAGTPEAKSAQDFLEDVNHKIPPGQRTPPSGFMDDDTFRGKCIEHIRALQRLN